MKIKTIWFVVILLVVATFFINLSLNKEGKNFKPLELNVGDVFNQIDYPGMMYVLNYAIGDVTGDGEKDMVILIGEKETADSLEAQKIDLVVYDNVLKTFSKAGFKNFAGEYPKITFCDLTGDKFVDIIVTVDNKDGTKNLRAVTNENNSLKEILSQKDNKGVVFIGEIIDGVKAHVRCSKLNKELYIDLLNKKAEYIQNKKVDESGKIICEDKKVVTTGFITVEIVELNEQNGIQTTQRICAFNELDIIDEITVIWKYENGKWQIKDARGAIIGSLIY